MPVGIDKPVVSEASATIVDMLSSLPNEPVEVAEPDIIFLEAVG